MTYLWVAIGGALGSVARFACSSAGVRWLGAGFPYSTLFVNVTGSFAIGLLATLVASDGRPLLNADARAFLLVGVLGGFTTFSSFSLETLRLASSCAHGAAALNVVLSVGLCLFGAWLGFAAGGLLNR